MDTHATTLHLKADVYRKLKLQSAVEYRSMTSLINELCEQGLKHRASDNQHRIEEFAKILDQTK
tara:strand:+ start:721 stop:912 length:192 start_codon:yes stop_codon:yes gene_type:complete